MVVGGNVPAKGGRPDIMLKSFTICPNQDLDGAPEDEEEEIKNAKKPPKRL